MTIYACEDVSVGFNRPIELFVPKLWINWMKMISTVMFLLPQCSVDV